VFSAHLNLTFLASTLYPSHTLISLILGDKGTASLLSSYLLIICVIAGSPLGAILGTIIFISGVLFVAYQVWRIGAHPPGNDDHTPGNAGRIEPYVMRTRRLYLQRGQYIRPGYLYESGGPDSANFLGLRCTQLLCPWLVVNNRKSYVSPFDSSLISLYPVSSSYLGDHS